jgi:hypothetical protein
MVSLLMVEIPTLVLTFIGAEFASAAALRTLRVMECGEMKIAGRFFKILQWVVFFAMAQ